MSAAKTKEAVKVEAGTKEAAAVDELAKVGTAVTGIAAALIGAWGVVCIAAAAVTEGPVTLVKGFFASF